MANTFPAYEPTSPSEAEGDGQFFDQMMAPMTDSELFVYRLKEASEQALRKKLQEWDKKSRASS